MSASATPPLFHINNALSSPASSLAGLAGILGVVGQSLTNGWPTTSAGWITVGISILTGVGAILARA